MKLNLQLANYDVIDTCSELRTDSFDACFCDPPYGLKFMGKKWDHGVPGAEYWSEVLRVLKPGAPILAFGGTRTYHRLACAIEDAGFEIFDSILASAWVYGQGFPKSLDIGKAIDKAAGAERPVTGKHTEGRRATPKQDIRGGKLHAGEQSRTIDLSSITAPATDAARLWDGYGTALKPAWEPIVFARKPLDGTYAANCIEHGCGGLNIEGCRIEGKPRTTHADGNRVTCESSTEHLRGKHVHGPVPGADGRYPANLLLSHHPDCSPLGTRQGEDGLEEIEAWECHPECPVAGLDRQSGITRSAASGYNFERSVTDNPSRVVTNIKSGVHFGDSGGASRFFYCAKVSTAERHAGGVTNGHATLKPLALTTYLARLILPPPHIPSRLLVPFCGTGSEIAGSLIAGWSYVLGIDNDRESISIAHRRIPALLKRSKGL